MTENKIITITGPSGVGKTRLKRTLKEQFGLKEIPFYTTREPREDDNEEEETNHSKLIPYKETKENEIQ